MENIKKVNKKNNAQTIARLPRYINLLNELKTKNVASVSSKQLSEMTGFSPSLIRYDVSSIGKLGKRGTSYDVDILYREIRHKLAIDRSHTMIVIGVGNLGQAIACNKYYCNSVFRIVGLYDINPKIIGMKINNLPVQDFENLEHIMKFNKIDIAVICTQNDSAQQVADVLCRGGIKGIWNLTSREIHVPDDVSVHNFYLIDSLNMLAYSMYNKRVSGLLYSED